MANDLNTSINNTDIADPGTFRSAASGTLPSDNRVIRTKDSPDVLRLQTALDQTKSAASRLDRAFAPKATVGLRPSPAANLPKSSEAVLGNTGVQPIISILDEERIGPGLTLKYTDGSITKTSINAQGLYQELTSRADKSSTLAVYQDFPPDDNGLPTGYRVNYTDKNSSGKIVSKDTASLIISDLGNGKLLGNFVLLTDTNNPVNLYNSVLTKSNVTDEAGHQIYNSKTSFPDGRNYSKVYTPLQTGTAFDVELKTGYLQTITSTAVDETVTTTLISTINKTDAQGNRVTTITDVTDPDNPVLISQSSKPDPFIRGVRKFGTEMSAYLDYLSQAGFLDIDGDGKNDPKTDLVLLNRYSRGLRGNALTANLNLGENAPSVDVMETKMADAFKRGLYDINGNKATDSTKRDTVIDINLIARYMIGARNGALTDGREANDDSISIAANGSNVVALADTDPLLNDFRQIFNLDGVGIKTSTQNLKVFYVNFEQTGPVAYDTNAGRIIRNNDAVGGDLHYIRNGGYAAPLNQVSAAANGRRPITRLGDLTAKTFSSGAVTAKDYGL